MAIPQIITAGTTVKFTYLDGRYSPNDGWIMTLYLVGKSGLSVQAITNGSEFDFTIAASVTSTIPDGYVTWELRASKSTTGEVYPVASGVMQVRPDISQLTYNQLHEEKMLGYIRAQIEGRLSKKDAINALSIDSRALTLMTMKELQDLEADYQERLYAIRHRGTAGRLKFTNIGI